MYLIVDTKYQPCGVHINYIYKRLARSAEMYPIWTNIAYLAPNKFEIEDI